MSGPQTTTTSDVAQPVEEGAAPPLSGLRALAVTIGPSVVLEAVFALSTAVAFGAIARRPSGRFARILRLVAAFGAAAPWIYMLALRRWVLHWGATKAEVTANLPGDELVPDPVWQSTRAIDINAPVEAVWPWLAQTGQNRGGLYTYDWLENLAGLDFHSADHVVPEWQAVNVGDFVRFAPNQDALVVAEVEPNQCLVWRLLQPGTHQAAHLSPGTVAVDATWAFILRATDGGHCRLIERFRFGSRPRAFGALYTALLEIPHFLMGRRMLLGIRQRAEHASSLPLSRDPRRRKGV